MLLTSRDADSGDDVISERTRELGAGCGAVPPAGEQRGGADATRPLGSAAPVGSSLPAGGRRG